VREPLSSLDHLVYGDVQREELTLLVDSSSRIYGTSRGGPNPKDYGTVFQLFKAGNGWTANFLVEFQGGSQGTTPVAGVAVDPTGKKNLFGTTCDSGTSLHGSVYELPIGGQLKPLYSFVGGAGDGWCPISSELVVDSAGNVFGTTHTGDRPTAERSTR
jgi:hypothetical protein